MERREMRRKDRAMNDEQIMTVIENNQICYLSMNGTNGYPYVVPLNYVYMDGMFVMHCAEEGYKMDCLKNDARVCLSIAAQGQILTEGRIPCESFTAKFSSIIAFGNIKIVEGEEKIDLLSRFTGKYLQKSKDDIGAEEKDFKFMMRTGVIILKPDYITGKR